MEPKTFQTQSCGGKSAAEDTCVLEGLLAVLDGGSRGGVCLFPKLHSARPLPPPEGRQGPSTEAPPGAGNGRDLQRPL